MRDLATLHRQALMYAPGILAEAREIRDDDSITPEQALDVIIGARWPDLPEREAYAACAARYDVELEA